MIATHSELLSPPDVAEITQFGISTIRRWIDSGLIPASRSVGGHRKVSREDLLSFLQQRKLPIPRQLRSERQRVVMIDDDAPLLRRLKSLLEKQAPTVDFEVAESATQGLILAAARRPDVVILDALMDGYDGFEACRCLKTTPETAQIKILGISGDTRSEARFRAEGVDAFLLKPFSAATVIEVLRLMHVGDARLAMNRG